MKGHAMLGDLHEQIINDVSTVLSLALMPVYPKFPEIGSFWFTPDAGTANPFVNPPKMRGRSISADMYIFPDDLAGAILVEVGDARVGKWNFLSHNNQPVRVLRVTKDRTCGLTNRRWTAFETDLMAALEDWLQDVEALEESHRQKMR